MTQVAILWHMHQPFYEDLVTHEHFLPWVRLHAIKDYWGMAALLREFPDVKVTFNLVPSLLVQLEDFAAGRAHDRCLELSLKPAAALTPADVDFMLENFFHAHRQHMIDAHPRYAELLARRGAFGSPASARQRAALGFSLGDLRDLQVWHKLAWIDPQYFETDARIQGLAEKGKGFDEDDKSRLREVELEILNRVIPEYREAAARGQIEISTSPFYHPILPLLCDTDVYLRTHPHTSKPRQRFVHPEDAADQLDRAVACHERLFGRRPVGLWPSEGSVSDAMVPLVARAGFRWMATDESILASTLGIFLPRDGHGHLDEPERLYAPYLVGGQGAADGVACAFRDHALSDLIGFVYSNWAPEAAADDFVGRLAEAGRRYADRTGGGEAFIPIILDGENAWEHFTGGGRPFLRALYGRLSHHPELRTVTMAEGCTSPKAHLPGIFPGSWIDGNFYIWIGHKDDQRAWSQLAEARDVLEAARNQSGADDPAWKAAREEVLVAEGSDWFWWYGDDHSSDHDAEFDDLFRRHLRNVYRLLHRPVPDELFHTNISTVPVAEADTDPTGLLTPTLDGENTSYFEWLGAGVVEVHEAAGAMHQTDRRPPVATQILFGFDLTRFYLRVDCGRRVADLLGEGYQVVLTFLQPASTLVFRRPNGPVPGHQLTPGAVAAVATVLEVAVPLADLGVVAGDVVSFAITILDASGAEIERHPGLRPVEVTVPDRAFETRNWTA